MTEERDHRPVERTNSDDIENGSRRVKIIFLDIDGVLVNHRSWDLQQSFDHLPADERCVQALNRIVALTGALIVVTSSWRIDRDLAELREIINQRFGVTGQVIDKTPRITREVFPGKIHKLLIAAKRGDEIAAWLAKCEYNTNIQSFVILDDDSDMGELLNRTVLTDFKEGLTEADADRALEMLQ